MNMQLSFSIELFSALVTQLCAYFVDAWKSGTVFQPR